MIKIAYAALCYVVFLGAFLWSIAWVGDFGAPKTIDSGAAGPLARALLVDGALLGLFAVQHSVMARPAFKRAWTRVVPPAAERATYVLASSLVLLALLAFWEPLPGVVWDASSPGLRALAWAGFALGWGIVLASTFMIDHFHLFGLKQAWIALRGEAQRDPSFRKVLLYRVVRHPIMLGFVIAFWSTPHMTVGHLVFAIATTGYILVGVRLEERDLRRALGDTYARYQAEVPMLVPVPRGRRTRGARAVT